MNSSEELNAEVSIEKSVSTTKKRKVRRDPDASKKQAGPKRRRKASGSPSPVDLVAFQNQHANGPTSLSLNVNVSDSSMKGDALSEASRPASKKSGRKTRESNFPLAAASHSIDLQKGNVSTKQAASDDGDYDSEDEAPETVSAAAGLLQSRQAAADVAKIEEIKKTASKSKRREHDARLKTQAKSAKERALIDQMAASNAPKLETTSKATAAGHHDATIAAKWSIGDPLPEFLPDEILAAVPEIPPASVPSGHQSRKSPVKSKLKVFQTKSNRRKRLKRGSTVYRVLEDDRGNLPPKVAKRSMQLREYWLRGRTDPRGKDIVCRRKAGGGFVRRQ